MAAFQWVNPKGWLIRVAAPDHAAAIRGYLNDVAVFGNARLGFNRHRGEIVDTPGVHVR
jgi:hypothetical protein